MSDIHIPESEEQWWTPQVTFTAGTPVYRCTYCGQFYSTRTKHKHRACHMIEEKRIVEGKVSK